MPVFTEFINNQKNKDTEVKPRKRRIWSELDTVFIPDNNSELRNNNVEITETDKNNSTQQEKKTGSKLVANYEQTGSKLVANYEQTGSKVVASDKYNNSKLVAQPVAELVANYEQTGSKLVANTTFGQLSGLQKNLLIFIYLACRQKGSKISPPLSLEQMSQNSKTSTGTTKNALLRLCKKGLIKKFNFKNGRGGWTQYEIYNGVYSDMLHLETGSKLVANYEQTSSKVVAQPVAQPVATVSSSSSYNNIITTTTESSDFKKIADDLNIEHLEHIGFTKTHLIQILQSHPTQDLSLIQESIDHIAFYLTIEASKGITEPLKWVMKKLRVDGFFHCDGFQGWENEALKKFQIYKEKQREERERRLNEIIQNLSQTELYELEKTALPLAAKELNITEDKVTKNDPVLRMMMKSKIRGLVSQQFIQSSGTIKL